MYQAVLASKWPLKFKHLVSLNFGQRFGGDLGYTAFHARLWVQIPSDLKKSNIFSTFFFLNSYIYMYYIVSTECSIRTIRKNRYTKVSVCIFHLVPRYMLYRRCELNASHDLCVFCTIALPISFVFDYQQVNLTLKYVCMYM